MAAGAEHMERQMDGNSVKRIAFVGDHTPRQCGIATFTSDLCDAVSGTFPATDVFVVPVNDTAQGYNYPPRIRFEFAEQELASYRRAADFLNINDVDVVCLQHEFGIYGGPAGSHVIALLRDLRMPVVTTLHTVLKDPSPNYKQSMEDVCALSDRIVVMSEHSHEFLRDIYSVPEEKIDHVPHGIPDIPFVDPNFYKEKFGVEGKKVILTFGLLSPNKGIEYAIQALPEVIKKHPEVVYICLGATHPQLKREQGETYRLSLQQMVRSLGLEEHVIFHNRFVSIEELCEFIGSADIYVTPYLNEAQVVSGTLAYSVGAGKAVISTPYWYAEEMLSDGRGLIAPFKSHEAIAEKINYMLDHETERHAMRKRAYELGRDMVWREVAKGYMESYERAREEGFKKPRSRFTLAVRARISAELPQLKLDHLQRITDDTGMIQHASYSVPNYHEGYSTDDNARGIVLCAYLEELGEPMAREASVLMGKYLSFLFYAFNSETGRFRNFLAYSRRWLEEAGSDDSHARSLWALGVAAGRSRDSGHRGLATRLFDEALPRVHEFNNPRSYAFALLGIMEFMRRFYGHRAAQDARLSLAEKLLKLYDENSKEDWLWFEDELTYCNAKIPHALFSSGQWLDRSDMVEAGLQALRWLIDVQHMDSDHFVPIGCHGFYRRGGERARFDQQPIEAHSTLSACLDAYRMTGDEFWRKEAQIAFNWYLGSNDLNAVMYNSRTGGCFDGLTPDRVNQNQGAESTLAFLLSLTEMTLAENIIRHSEEEKEKQEA
jgi:glycosyltransferase involved in cell wall biosynthesis